ncbi:MAG: GxxExxY protein [Gemmatimonadaceae bacterium]
MKPDHSSRTKLIHAPISSGIIGCFYDVYNELGYGFREYIYARAMEIVLRERGFTVEREFPIKVFFRGQQIGFHRCDMLVDKLVIVEFKSTELLPEAPKTQTRNYLSAARLELGMLLHFGPKPNYYRILGPIDSSRSEDRSG